MNKRQMLASNHVPSSIDTEKSSEDKLVLRTLTLPAISFTEITNNRYFYPLESLMVGLKDPRVVSAIQEKKMYCEVNHPNLEVEKRLITQLSSNIGGNITDIQVDESRGCLVATMDILNTEGGRLVDMLLRYGSRLGLSIRAYGNKEARVDADGNEYFHVLPEGFTLYGWDIVISPSSTIALIEQSDVESAMLESIDSMMSYAKPEELSPIKGYLSGLLLESDNPRGKEIFNYLNDITEGGVFFEDDGSESDYSTYGYQDADYAVGQAPDFDLEGISDHTARLNFRSDDEGAVKLPNEHVMGAKPQKVEPRLNSNTVDTSTNDIFDDFENEVLELSNNKNPDNSVRKAKNYDLDVLLESNGFASINSGSNYDNLLLEEFKSMLGYEGVDSQILYETLTGVGQFSKSVVPRRRERRTPNIKGMRLSEKSQLLEETSGKSTRRISNDPNDILANLGFKF